MLSSDHPTKKGSLLTMYIQKLTTRMHSHNWLAVTR